MSEKKFDGKAIVKIENLPEELVPVYEWLKANGTSLLYAVLALVVALTASSVIKNYRVDRRNEAASVLGQDLDVPALESAAGRFGKSKEGLAIRMKLASKYYDEANYQRAAEEFGKAAKSKKDHPLHYSAKLGLALCRESEGNFAEAEKIYGEIISACGDSPLGHSAIAGRARSLAGQGKKDEALALLENDDSDLAGRARLIAEAYDPAMAMEAAAPSADDMAAPADAADVAVGE